MAAFSECHLLDIRGVCEALKIKRTTFHRVRGMNFPRPILVGRSKRWIPAEVKAWQEEQRRAR